MACFSRTKCCSLHHLCLGLQDSSDIATILQCQVCLICLLRLQRAIYVSAEINSRQGCFKLR